MDEYLKVDQIVATLSKQRYWYLKYIWRLNLHWLNLQHICVRQPQQHRLPEHWFLLCS